MEKTWQTLWHINRIYLALTIKIATILIATVALFAQDLIILFNDALRSETTSYMITIPFIFIYLVYRKRKMLKVATVVETSESQNTNRLLMIVGILLSASAVLLYWYGSCTFTPLEYHLAALPFFAGGLVLIIFNLQTLRQLAFPVAFLVFLTPPPSEILYALGTTLSVVSAVVSNAIVNASGIQSMLSSEFGSPTILITRPDGSTMTFAVDIACSGIYSLLGFLVFALLIVYIIRDKLWKKLGILLIGFPLIYLLNIIRITIILLIGYNSGEELALNVFHLLGGWTLIFFGTLLLLFISEKIFKTQIFARPAGKCPKHDKPQTKENFCLECGRIMKITPRKLSKSDIVKIVAVVLGVALIVSIQAPVFALTEAPTIVTTTSSGEEYSTSILPLIQGYNLSFYCRDAEFEARAHQDMSIIYYYSPLQNQSGDVVFVTFEIASISSVLHPWEKCLITWPILQGYQPRVSQVDLRDVMLIENPPIIGRYFAFQRLETSELQVVLYWYETATFKVDSTSQQKYVKISLEAFPTNLEDVPALEDQLLVFGKRIANYWEPIKTWSQITMLLSLNGDKLVAITIAMLAGVIIFLLFRRRRKREANFYAYGKLSEPNKQIVNAVLETEKTITPTLSNIAATYKRITREPLRKQELLEELRKAETIGMIESTIANCRDEPIQVWRTQIAFPRRIGEKCPLNKLNLKRFLTSERLARS